MIGRAVAAVALVLLVSGAVATNPGVAAVADSIGTSAAPPVGWWRPTPGLDWQMQLAGPLDLRYGRDVFFLDLFDTPMATIDTLHARGTRVVCYFSAGSFEEWRPDAGTFPPGIIGRPLAGWPGERWLDVRSADLRPILAARLNLAVVHHCDGVDPDNVDGYADPTGFAIAPGDQITFNRWLADAAHARGLAVGLKNDIDQIVQLMDVFDWQVNEQCVAYDECDALMPFIAIGKPVFGLAYPTGDVPTLAQRTAIVCPEANRRGFDTPVKPLDLTTAVMACRSLTGT